MALIALRYPFWLAGGFDWNGEMGWAWLGQGAPFALEIPHVRFRKHTVWNYCKAVVLSLKD